MTSQERNASAVWGPLYDQDFSPQTEIVPSLLYLQMSVENTPRHPFQIGRCPILAAVNRNNMAEVLVFAGEVARKASGNGPKYTATSTNRLRGRDSIHSQYCICLIDVERVNTMGPISEVGQISGSRNPTFQDKRNAVPIQMNSVTEPRKGGCSNDSKSFARRLVQM